VVDEPVPDLRLVIVGRVESSLAAGPDAPRQPDEGAPPARIRVAEPYRGALAGLAVGDRITIVTWLDRADRGQLTTHPRGDRSRDAVGVFATRSPDRPNPLGHHDVTITRIHGDGCEVDALEAFDGTPVVDVKPRLGPRERR
jgi:tRNA-Thr(GGU) m(6)t(6)A37 methyltransferase TsaA